MSEIKVSSLTKSFSLDEPTRPSYLNKGSSTTDLFAYYTNGLASPDGISTNNSISVKPTNNRNKQSLKANEEKDYREYRRSMDALVQEADKALDYLNEDELTDESSGVVTEINALLEKLYESPFSEGECLKQVVTVLQIPTRNAKWTRQHVEFLRTTLRILRVQYLIDASTVKICKDTLKAYGFDLFRGTVSTPQVVRKYKLTEVRLDG